MIQKPLFTFLTLLAGCVLLPSAYASAITVTGTAKGCFGASCTPTTTASDSHLSFTGDAFTGTTTYDAILGVFDLDNGTHTYTGEPFELLLTYTVPQGSNNTTYTTTLSGSVHGNSGTVTIDFSNPTQTVNYSGVSGTGTFTVALDQSGDFSISSGGTTSITATITSDSGTNAPTIPEPASVTLFGAGAGFLALGSLRRRASR